MGIVKLSVQNISYTFADTGRGCKNVTFEASLGELTVIKAPSGAGKSTAIAVISGILQPQSGTVILDGKPLINGQSAILLQKAQLFVNLTAWENVACAWGIPNLKYREKAVSELQKYGVADVATSIPNQMSGGQQQRVALVAALAQNKPVLLVDEPTSNLDQLNSKLVIDTLVEAAKHCVVVVATHDERLCSITDHVVNFAG